MPLQSPLTTRPVSLQNLFSIHFFPRLACRELLLTFFFVLVPKGGYEPTDIQLEAAASREALEEGLAVCHLRLVTS